MGYASLVKGQVKGAFAAVKDLAKDVVLTSSTPTGFNFGTVAVTAGATATKTIKAIIVTKKRKKREDGSPETAVITQLLMNAADVDDPTIYDTVSIGGVVWNIIPPYENNGYTITVEIVRGG